MSTPINVYYVYAYLRNSDSETGKSGTPYYIGKGKRNRAYEKHGLVPVPDKSNIIFLYKNLPESEAYKLEISLIAKYGRKDLGTGILLNRTNGGEGGIPPGGIPWNKGKKGAQKAWNKGKTGYLSEESLLKISKSSTGRKQSQATINKRSKAMMGKNKGKPSPFKGISRLDLKGKPSPNKGKVSPLKGVPGRIWSEEEKLALSNTKKGQPWSQARRDAQNRKKQDEITS